MVRIEGQIVIDRPVEEVFDFVADERNEPRYNPLMRRAEKISEGSIGVGTRYRAETASMGRAVPMVIEVTDYERPRRIASTTHMSSMDIQYTLTFEPVPEGTRMRWSGLLAPRGILKVMGPLVALMGRRQEQRIWTGLKHLLEGTGELIFESPGGLRTATRGGWASFAQHDCSRGCECGARGTGEEAYREHA